MMRARPLFVFVLVAGSMVAWLSVRMWGGGDSGVWKVSCLLGAWAPLMAASLFLYVRRVGDRESSVLAAWLVRAIGMHCVLVWMLGVSDWLRGPPRQPSQWNTDVGAPLVMLSFVPVFVLSVALLQWLCSVARRLRGTLLRPTMPSDGTHRAIPFRGLPLATTMPSTKRLPVGSIGVGGMACLLAFDAPEPSYWLVAAAAVVLAALTVQNDRALAPSVTGLIALVGVLLARQPATEDTEAVALGMSWPWLSALAVALYLAIVEGWLRLRREAAR